MSVELTVCPDCEVPPPRAVTLTPSSRASARVYSTSFLLERARRHGRGPTPPYRADLAAVLLHLCTVRPNRP